MEWPHAQEHTRESSPLLSHSQSPSARLISAFFVLIFARFSAGQLSVVNADCIRWISVGIKVDNSGGRMASVTREIERPKRRRCAAVVTHPG